MSNPQEHIKASPPILPCSSPFHCSNPILPFPYSTPHCLKRTQMLSFPPIICSSPPHPLSLSYLSLSHQASNIFILPFKNLSIVIQHGQRVWDFENISAFEMKIILNAKRTEQYWKSKNLYDPIPESSNKPII